MASKRDPQQRASLNDNPGVLGGGHYGQHPLKSLRNQIKEEQDIFEEQYNLFSGMNQDMPEELLRGIDTMNERPCVTIERKSRAERDKKKKEEEKAAQGAEEQNPPQGMSDDIIGPVRERSDRDVVFCGTQFAPAQKQPASSLSASNGQPKKKMSLFAQRMAAKKAGAATAASASAASSTAKPGSTPIPSMVSKEAPKTEDGFPIVEKLDTLTIKESIPSDLQAMKASASVRLQQDITKVGISADREIHEENVQKIVSLSKEEVLTEQQDLLKMFSPQQLAVLKRMGTKQAKSMKQPAGGGAGAVGSAGSAAVEEEQKRTEMQSEASSKPYSQPWSQLSSKEVMKETSLDDVQKKSDKLNPHEDIGKAAQEQYLEDQKNQDDLASLRIDREGAITFVDVNLQAAVEEGSHFEINYADQLDLVDFMNLPQRAFSLKEILSLLSSTSHHHQSFALRLIESCLLKHLIRPIDVAPSPGDRERTFLLEALLAPSKTRLLSQIDRTAFTNSHRLDFLDAYLSLKLQILNFFFGDELARGRKSQSRSLLTWSMKPKLHYHQVFLHEARDPREYQVELIFSDYLDTTKQDSTGTDSKKPTDQSLDLHIQLAVKALMLAMSQGLVLGRPCVEPILEKALQILNYMGRLCEYSNHAVYQAMLKQKSPSVPSAMEQLLDYFHPQADQGKNRNLEVGSPLTSELVQVAISLIKGCSNPNESSAVLQPLTKHRSKLGDRGYLECRLVAATTIEEFKRLVKENYKVLL